MPTIFTDKRLGLHKELSYLNSQLIHFSKWEKLLSLKLTLIFSPTMSYLKQYKIQDGRRTGKKVY